MLKTGVRLAVFSLKKTPKGNTIWSRAGNAYVNRDGSLNVYLDVLPLHGTLHLREPPDAKQELVDTEASMLVTAPPEEEHPLFVANAPSTEVPQ